MKLLSLSFTLLALAACNPPAPSAETKTTPPPAPPPTPAPSSLAPEAARLAVDSAAPKAAPLRTDTFATPQGELGVTPIHHATLLFQYAGKAIYVDPVSKDVSYEGLPKADYVFITDIHPDHMDPAGLEMVKKSDTVVVAPPAVNEKMPAGVVMKNGDTHDFISFTVEAIPMYNLTRGPAPGKLFHDKGRGDGFVFNFGKGDPKVATVAGDAGLRVSRVYVSGDTECVPEMRALKNIDVAFVCMNLPYTMPPSEAATCVNAFKPKVLFPYHYRDSNLDELKVQTATEVRRRAWY